MLVEVEEVAEVQEEDAIEEDPSRKFWIGWGNAVERSPEMERDWVPPLFEPNVYNMQQKIRGANFERSWGTCNALPCLLYTSDAADE